jgi:heat shock protein HslJ
MDKMKRMKWIAYILVWWGMISCADKANFSTKELKENEKIYWVAGTMVDCIGVAKMNCIQIQIGDKIEEGNWTLFYNDIDGFLYEPGYIYKLVVREEILPEENLPADVSNLQISLVKVLEKKRAN